MARSMIGVLLSYSISKPKVRQRTYALLSGGIGLACVSRIKAKLCTVVANFIEVMLSSLSCSYYGAIV